MAVEVNVERKGVEVTWDAGDYDGEVTIVATGDAGDKHNTRSMKNDGKALLAYPADFKGMSSVQVLTEEDVVLDEGDIEVIS